MDRPAPLPRLDRTRVGLPLRMHGRSGGRADGWSEEGMQSSRHPYLAVGDGIEGEHELVVPPLERHRDSTDLHLGWRPVEAVHDYSESAGADRRIAFAREPDGQRVRRGLDVELTEPQATGFMLVAVARVLVQLALGVTAV